MRNWLEVNLITLEKNIQEIKRNLKENTQLIAVVKANAYGHGDVQIAKKLEALGLKIFAVASLKEGLSLRNAGIKGEILVLSYVDLEDAYLAYENNISLTLVSYEYAKGLSAIAAKMGIAFSVHVKLNTGMNRIGFECKNDQDRKLLLDCYKLPGFNFKGIFSHFSSSDDLSEGAYEYTLLQNQRFQDTLSFLDKNGIKPGLRHISNSGAIGKYKDFNYDAVRCGALMYGYNTALDAKINVKPIGTWYATISCIRTLKKEDAVSYSRHYIAKGDEQVATVCVGYADGYKRALSGNDKKSFVLCKGKPCRILGNICMDQMMIDVTGLDVKMGDELVLMGEGLDADMLAEFAGTCMHDIISSIGPRVEKVYIDDCR